ncbi:pyridoxamine 5'-phosphate oxidase family protein [Halorubrum gandharaense]
MSSKLTDAEIDALLCEEGVGVLAFTDGKEAYSIPESFGYDSENERLYFQFVYTSDSKKMAFLETTETATFTVYSENPARSVLVSGTVEPITENEQPRATTAIAENASIPTLNVYPGADPDEITMAYYRLLPDNITGREFQAYAPSSADQ